MPLLGFEPYQITGGGLLFPMYGPDGALAGFQFRADVPRLRDGKPVKYETPQGAKNMLDVHPRMTQHLGNPAYSLIITEGVKKGDALSAPTGSARATQGYQLGTRARNPSIHAAQRHVGELRVPPRCRARLRDERDGVQEADVDGDAAPLHALQSWYITLGYALVNGRPVPPPHIRDAEGTSRLLACVGKAARGRDKETVKAALVLLWASQHLDNLWRLEAHLGERANAAGTTATNARGLRAP